MLRKFEAREVAVGPLRIGGRQPVVIQSMTNTDTLDVRATVEQIKRLVEAGCALVRVTTPAFKHVEALAEIKNTLHKEGCTVPLAADVHFLPEVAVQAAQVVEKVRINPGNYVDKPTGQATFTAADHEAARQRMAERLGPLLDVCRANGTAIRLGVNHGSLSERMLRSAASVPQAMVASAVEFIEVCEAQDFRNLVLSMKSSSVRQMREAVLLAVEAMRSRGDVYPLHLGVTEAGNGLDGRLISAVGIGGLLKAGIGDTIRVSLTEAPEKEIPVARAIVRWAEAFAQTPAPVEGAGVEQAPAPDWARIPAADVPVAAAVAYADRLLQGDETVSLADTALTAAERKTLLDDLYQAAERRYHKARFVACPSCGRTQYNIEEVLDKVKRRFAGYKGFTIAVMGCVVNGPGEMADADYGYIGCGGGRVNLYRKGQLVEQGIPEADALDALGRLIESDGRA
ncbi:MAG: (E)-4-hydroxy-3-methylbut-2-enyl-diphosphate synthase [Bacteroidales bacterium]|nr:(E)-4-hydroxy-3-methylbut-2-enyl-diphosphate synthase [Bacteroidales bacterium]